MKFLGSSKGRIKSFDSTDLYYVNDIPLNPRAIIVIVHGFGEHLGRYEYVKDKFLDCGYGVIRLDNRGHGKSGGERGHINSFKDFVKDIDVIIELIRNEKPNIPIFMLGHSMGGFIAGVYGVLYKNKLRGQIFSGAVTITPNQARGIKMILLRLVNKSLPKMRMKNPLVDNDEDELILRSATFKFYMEFLYTGIRWLRDNFINYEYPCLILHGEYDKVVDKEGSMQFYSSISSKDKDIKIYEGLKHEILNHEGSDVVLEDIHRWIEERR